MTDKSVHTVSNYYVCGVVSINYTCTCTMHLWYCHFIGLLFPNIVLVMLEYLLHFLSLSLSLSLFPLCLVKRVWRIKTALVSLAALSPTLGKYTCTPNIVYCVCVFIRLASLGGS